MKIEVSIGEAIDKLSILDLKMKKITDELKKKEIQKEIVVLYECNDYIQTFPLLYKLLLYINEQIWDMTDLIKSITIQDTKFSYISQQIFEFNQKRFRIKNWFNLLTNSNIKEQKSYSEYNLNIIINDIDIFKEKIIDFYFLSLDYDNITIISNFNDIIKELINIPVTTYVNLNEKINSNKFISLDNYSIDKNIKKLFI
jgi:hypothetical protein